MKKHYYEEAVRHRRELHRIAEPAWLEIRSTIYVLEALKDTGLELIYGRKIHGNRMGVPSAEEYLAAGETCKDLWKTEYKEIFEGYTGLYAVLDTGRPGPVTGLRFDLDALPLEESCDAEHYPVKQGFVSVNRGVMHACGHDGHTAVGIVLAGWASENSGSLCGKLIFIFQPAEEGVRGAASLLDSGGFPQMDYFYGMHIGLGMEDGVAGIGTEEFFGTDNIEIDFQGQSAHSGNSPEKGQNSLLAAATAALGIHSIPQYSTGVARANVGILNAGTSRNMVPGSAKIGMGVRGDRKEVLDYLNKRVREVAEGAAAMYGNTCEVRCLGHSDCYSEVDEELAAEVMTALRDNHIPCRLHPAFRASEDVTTLMNHVEQNGGRSLHVMIGSELAAGHHNSAFDFRESCLKLALDVLEQAVLLKNT